MAANTFHVVNASTVTATLNISSTATLTTRQLGLATPIGNTNTESFTITGATVTSVAPNTGVRGTAVPVTIIGSNFTDPATVTLSGTNVTAGAATVVDSTHISTTFTISANATLGNRNVVVTTPDGSGTLTNGFAVQGATLTSISPTAHTRGGAGFTVTLTGTNLTGATNITVSGGGVTVTNVTPVSSTTVTATFTISGTATQSGRNVAVVTPIGNTNNVAFTVQ